MANFCQLVHKPLGCCKHKDFNCTSLLNKTSLMHNSPVEWIFIWIKVFLARSMSSDQTYFHMKSCTPGIVLKKRFKATVRNGFIGFALIRDTIGLKKITPLFPPVRGKPKINRDSLAHVFARFAWSTKRVKVVLRQLWKATELSVFSSPRLSHGWFTSLPLRG